ncbi:MAG: hypothetical protein ACKOED_11145 [Aestuariivirga sp.]|uniref:hypothetical protein n=1 Tax=Aestuariivirga sp. TaxID=2650926 RepID=UPI0038D13FF7
MACRIEHFVYGSATGLKRFRATVAAGIEISTLPGGLILRETLCWAQDIDTAVGRIEALALAQGLQYDGYGQDFGAGDQGAGLDIQYQAFTDRTGIRAGHGFALPLPDGRFGHAVYLGSNRQGYLLLDISALVADQPVSPDTLRDAPRRYRQPILVFHTGFDALPLASLAPLARLPCTVLFRCGIGEPPDPEEIARLERRFAVSATDTPEGWNALLMALAEAGERLPGTDSYALFTARAGRTGTLKLIEDYTMLQFADKDRLPMPWQPANIQEIIAILAGGPDVIAAADHVT